MYDYIRFSLLSDITPEIKGGRGGGETPDPPPFFCLSARPSIRQSVWYERKVAEGSIFACLNKEPMLLTLRAKLGSTVENAPRTYVRVAFSTGVL